MALSGNVYGCIWVQPGSFLDFASYLKNLYSIKWFCMLPVLSLVEMD